MLAIIRDDTWNVLNMQHITPNSKRWDYSDTPGGGYKKIKGPAHMVEGGHHLRKAPNTHPRHLNNRITFLASFSDNFYYFYDERKTGNIL